MEHPSVAVRASRLVQPDASLNVAGQDCLILACRQGPSLPGGSNRFGESAAFGVGSRQRIEDCRIAAAAKLGRAAGQRDGLGAVAKRRIGMRREDQAR